MRQLRGRQLHHMRRRHGGTHHTDHARRVKRQRAALGVGREQHAALHLKAFGARRDDLAAIGMARFRQSKRHRHRGRHRMRGRIRHRLEIEHVHGRGVHIRGLHRRGFEAEPPHRRALRTALIGGEIGENARRLFNAAGDGHRHAIGDQPLYRLDGIGIQVSIRNRAHALGDGQCCVFWFHENSFWGMSRS